MDKALELGINYFDTAEVRLFVCAKNRIITMHASGWSIKKIVDLFVR